MAEPRSAPTVPPTEGPLARGSDVAALYARRWQPAAPRGQVLVVHGYMDHGGRYAELAARLAAAGLVVVAPDLRGHGRSRGRRGAVRAFDEYLDDLDAAFATLAPDDGPRFILGHSHGGLLALDWATRRQPALAGCIVTNPYLRLALRPPRIKVAVGRLAARVAPWLALPAGLGSEQLSRDPEVVAAHRADPLVFGHANAGWFGAVGPAQRRVMALRQVPVPLLFIFSDADPIADAAASRALAARLSAPHKDVWERRGELHEVLHERDRAALHADIVGWIAARLAPPAGAGPHA